MPAERRFLAAPMARLKVEARAEGQPPVIEGYGAVFYRAVDPGTEYQLWQDTYERIMPGAFDLEASADVRSLFNHDPAWVLGRTKSQPSTLELQVDDVGLLYRVSAPDTQAVKDRVVEPIRRGDIDGSSFMFYPKRVTWLEEVRDGRQVEIRQIELVDLVEVGPVTFPAYLATSAGTRAAGDLVDVRAEHDARRRQRAADQEAWVRVSQGLRRAR